MNNLWKDVTGIISSIGSYIPKPEAKEIEKIQVVVKEKMPTASHFVRLAGLSGAVAVAMGAYGAHGFRNSEPGQKEVFDTGYRLHLVHSAALLASPLTNRPTLVGGFMVAGILLFSGSCYYHALSGNTNVRWITPYGGMCFIFGWLAMML